MFFFRWLHHRPHQKPNQPRPLRLYRPVLQPLEDRTVPSGFGRGFPSSLLPAAGSATHLIDASGSSTSGTISGNATTTVKAAPVATQLLVITSEQAAVGAPTNVTV